MRCIALEADARHLFADVWTTAGVVVGVLLVAITGWLILDPIIALLVAVNIIWTGARLLHETGLGLLDTALPKADLKHINAILDDYRTQGIVFHALRSRQAGSRRFVSFHVLVPGSWTVLKGHSMCEAIELAIRSSLPETTVFTHLEPREDPTSFADQALDRVPELGDPSETAPALEERPVKHERFAYRSSDGSWYPPFRLFLLIFTDQLGYQTPFLHTF